jgi:hypothetical protein
MNSLNNRVATIPLQKMASSNFSKLPPKEDTVAMRNKSQMILFKALVSQTRTKSTSNRRLILFTIRGVLKRRTQQQTVGMSTREEGHLRSK